MRKIALVVAFVLLNLQRGSPSFAETPEELLKRLDRGRNIDTRNQQIKKEQLEQQERRRLERYSRKWKKYGNIEINVQQWSQRKDGTWVAPAKAPNKTVTSCSDESLSCRLEAIRYIPIHWIGVNCLSLHVSLATERNGWGEWTRPGPDSVGEEILIDRCAKSGN